jgi:hypothetical protein
MAAYYNGYIWASYFLITMAKDGFPYLPVIMARWGLT